MCQAETISCKTEKNICEAKQSRLEKAKNLLHELTGMEPVCGLLRGAGYVNGKWVTSNTEFTIFSPATGEVIGFCYQTPEKAIDEAFREARKANFRWQHCVSKVRKRNIFKRLNELLELHKKRLATLFTHEGGKIFTNSLADIVESQHTVEAAERTQHHTHGITEDAQLENKTSGTWSKPFPVELAIKPFNFIAIYFWKVATSVMAGSAVVIKEAEQIPFSAMCMTALFHQAIREVLGAKRAEKLKALVQLLQGEGEDVGRYAVETGAKPESRSYDVISATGSWKMGSEVASRAAHGIKPQRLELSGHNRILYCNDYPTQKAADEISLGAFGDSGQRCVSTRAVFIPSVHHSAIVDVVIDRAKKLLIGNPLCPETQLGPIISKTQREAIDKAVKEAGYKPVLGGYPLTPENVERALAEGFTFNPDDFKEDGCFSRGSWYVPTIFTNLPFYHPIMRYEVFGPVVVINDLEWTWQNRLSSPEYDPEKDFWIKEYLEEKGLDKSMEPFLQGIALMNDNYFGLSAGLLSYDVRLTEIFKRLAEYGLIYCGRGTTGAEVDDLTEFGGFKMSGFGKEGGSVKNAMRWAQVYIDYDQKTRLAQRD